MLLDSVSNFAPQEFFEVAFRGGCGSIDLAIRKGLVEPYRDSGRSMGLASRVGTSGHGDRIIPDGLHQGLDLFCEGTAQDIPPESDRIVLVILKVRLKAKLPLN